MATIGVIKAVGTANFGGLNKGFRGAAQSAHSFGSSVRSAASTAITQFARIGLAIDGVQKIAQGIVSAVGGPLKLAAAAEQTGVAFEVLLGSAANAKSMMDELNAFAAGTPFQFPEIADAAKKLVAFGVAQEKVVPTLTSLGDVAAGLGIPFADLADIYGKAKVQGRLFMEDINQLAGRGIPIQDELAKQFGVSASEVRDLVSSGKVNFSHLEGAFQSLTGEGGKFAGLMEAQSKTLGGVWSTLQDNFNLVLTDVGNAIADTFNLKEGANALTNGIQTMMPKIKDFLGKAKSVINEIKPIVIQVVNVVIARFQMIAEQASMAFGAISGAVGGFLPSWQSFKTALLTGLIAAEFALKNWKEVGMLAFNSVLLSAVTFGNTVHHIFAVAIPHVLMYLATNWKTILLDMVEGTTTAFLNLSDNIVRVIKNIPKLIKGEVSFGELWTPLMDGAHFQLKQMDAIPERVMGDFERKLDEEVKSSADKLTQGFQEFRDQRMAQLVPPEVKQKLDEVTEAAKKASEAVEDSIPKELKDRAKEIFKSTRNAMEKFREEFGKIKEVFEKKLIDPETFKRAVQQLKADLFGEAKVQFAGASELGSQDARQSILRHRAGSNSDPLKNIEKLDKQQLDTQKESNRYLRRIADKDATVLEF